jgi:nucleotidyltransferase/DNA polymerase involved in DNA repair
MNNFYASVECMLDPALKKYPVAVCGSVEERHGIVLAKNYAAKAFGIKTGDAVSRRFLQLNVDYDKARSYLNSRGCVLWPKQWKGLTVKVVL